MHYKNGREAKQGDPVITKGYIGVVAVGMIYDLQPGQTSCNAMIERPIGGAWSVTIGECVHAEDALAALEATLPSNSPALPGPHSAVEPPNPAQPKVA